MAEEPRGADGRSGDEPAVSAGRLEIARAYVEQEEGATSRYGGLLAVGTVGDIQTIALDPDARGAGRGRLLMNALLDAAEGLGVREVFLEVRADNPVARGLYAALGFAEIGVRPRYYQPDDVDAVVMRLEMKGRR